MYNIAKLLTTFLLITPMDIRRFRKRLRNPEANTLCDILTTL